MRRQQMFLETCLVVLPRPYYSLNNWKRLSIINQFFRYDLGISNVMDQNIDPILEQCLQHQILVAFGGIF